MPWFRQRRSNNTGDKQTFRLGDMVRMKSGPFAPFKGKVEGINKAKRLLKVALLVFNQTKTLKVKFSEVEKLPAS